MMFLQLFIHVLVVTGTVYICMSIPVNLHSKLSLSLKQVYMNKKNVNEGRLNYFIPLNVL